MLTFEQIKELIELVVGRGLAGLEIERTGFRLRIDGRVAAAASTDRAADGGGSSGSMAPARAAPTTPPGSPASDLGESGPPEGAHIVHSPIVGTFYRASAPDADPFVEVGSRVKRGQVLCIVEAMKIMNEIECETDGVVLEIYPKNAQPIEFGEPLFALRAD